MVSHSRMANYKCSFKMAFKLRNRSGMIISIYLEHLVCIIEKIPATEMLLCVHCIISYFNYLHEASTRIQHDSSWRILNYLTMTIWSINLMSRRSFHQEQTSWKTTTYNKSIFSNQNWFWNLPHQQPIINLRIRWGDTNVIKRTAVTCMQHIQN